MKQNKYMKIADNVNIMVNSSLEIVQEFKFMGQSSFNKNDQD